MGGVAGGEKYIVNNVLFKFATDVGGIYAGGDFAASKVAAHDLKAHSHSHLYIHIHIHTTYNKHISRTHHHHQQKTSIASLLSQMPSLTYQCRA